MRKTISIFFLFLMLVRAIPALHFFSYQTEGYTCVDEKQLDDKSKEKKENKEFLSFTAFSTMFETVNPRHLDYSQNFYTAPILEFLTPPPDLG